MLPLFWSVTVLHLAGLALYRLAFWLTFRRTSPAASRGELLRAFGVGTRLDLRLVLLVGLPLLPMAALPVAGSPALRLVVQLYLVAAWAAITAVHLVDLAHYGYLKTRVNATAVEHLEAPGIALRTAWESFPIARGALALALLVAAQAAAVGRLIEAALGPAGAAPAGAGAASGGLLPGWLAWTLTVAGVIWGLHGRTGKFPLRWSDAYASSNPFVAALGLSPVLFLGSTWDNRRSRADAGAAREHYGELSRALGVDAPDAERLSLERRGPTRPEARVAAAPAAPASRRAGSAPARQPNIVFIILESHAGYKVGAFGNRLQPTPHFDALARRSLLFENFFAVTSPTARAVFTLLTGIPDVNAVHSASRNPLVVKQHTLLNAFTGHDKMYFIGGSASWGNIRGVLAHNVPDIELYEESAFEAPRVDGWGISDLHLFLEADRAFSQRKRPFVAFVHTSGNHRPWTIPEDNRGFRLETVSEAELNANGFDSLSEFNSFRFMDHSLGVFFEQARRSDWYRDTVFFLFGDHGAAAPHDIPWERLGLTHVHTPLLVHAPGRLPEGERRGDVVSSLDLLPTAAGLAGVPHVNATLGRDAFDGRPASERFAFVRLVPRYGLVGDQHLLTLPPGRGPSLFRYRSNDPCRDVAADEPEQAERMARLCRGYFETARVLLHGTGGAPARRPTAPAGTGTRAATGTGA